MPNKLIDLTGQRFGRLVVIERTEIDTARRPRWLCKCDCGAYKVVSSVHLKNGSTKSCGCLRREEVSKRSTEIARRIGKNNKTHGMRNTRLYHIWCGIKRRCLNPNAKPYDNYGGRGITICDEWKNDFMNFYNWAMANGYQENLTIDRKDNDGNYEPSNCRWASYEEQANNRRKAKYSNRTHCIEFNGEIHSLMEWSEITGINYGTLQKRIKLGWTIEKALTESVKKK